MARPAITLPYNYTPRHYQLPILQKLDSGTKRVVWCSHRRSGKDVTIFNWVIKKLIEEVSVAYYVCPTYAHGRKIIWDSLNNDGQRILDYCPKQIILSKNQQDMKICLINGSMLQIVGSDNIDSLVGTNPKIIIFSEYAMQSKLAWDFLRPIVKANGGYAIFISTPRGKNHFYDMRNIALDNPNEWYYQCNTVAETGVLTEVDIEQERRDGMSEELIQQEYYCSFDRGVDGSYYGKLIEEARAEKRICKVGYDPAGVVNTAWDIGYGDSTAIVFWQDIGGEMRIIDHYESQGESINYYARVLAGKRYVYGTHYFPHDAGSGSIQTGKTLQQIARDMGVPNTVLPRDDFHVGIEATRSLLGHCFIDQKNCLHLLKCLENYHKKFNDKNNCYSDTPVHDWSSHSADALRYVAMARQRYGKAGGGSGALTPDKIKEMRFKHLGY